MPMGQQKLGAHGESCFLSSFSFNLCQFYQYPNNLTAFWNPSKSHPLTYTFVNSAPSTRAPSPQYVINEIDATPLLPFSSASPALTNNNFSPPSPSYSSELPSAEPDARAEMEGDSPAKRRRARDEQ